MMSNVVITFLCFGFGLGFILFVYRRHIAEYVKELKQERKFKDFEKVLAGEKDGEKFFSGDVTLQEEVTVLLPMDTAKTDLDEALERFGSEIVKAFGTTEFGEVVRGYPTDDGIGIDVMLLDLVSGLDLLRQTLVSAQAPKGTLIEYSGGDLLIHDQ